MKRMFQAVITRDGDSFIGSCPEVLGANGQGRSVEECLDNLRDAIILILEDRGDEPPDGVGTPVPA
jgi:predicted RNase H-like HicB family nuclease